MDWTSLEAEVDAELDRAVAHIPLYEPKTFVQVYAGSDKFDAEIHLVGCSHARDAFGPIGREIPGETWQEAAEYASHGPDDSVYTVKVHGCAKKVTS